MKWRHRYYLGDNITFNKLDKNGWAFLRTQGDKAFALEETLDAYEKNCIQSTWYGEAADIIIGLLKNFDIREAISLGAGKGILEWNLIKKMPELSLGVTDYTTESVNKLKYFLTDCDKVMEFDIKEGNYQNLHTNCLIEFRISTEFDFEEWKNIFSKIYHTKIDYIIFVPTELLCWKHIVRETISCLLHKIKNQKMCLAGYLYSENEFKKMFKKQYSILEEVPYRDTKIYFLQRNS